MDLAPTEEALPAESGAGSEDRKETQAGVWGKVCWESRERRRPPLHLDPPTWVSQETCPGGRRSSPPACPQIGDPRRAPALDTALGSVQGPQLGAGSVEPRAGPGSVSVSVAEGGGSSGPARGPRPSQSLGSRLLQPHSARELCAGPGGGNQM